MTTRMTPQLAGIHHLKFPVTDIATSVAWFNATLGGTRTEALDHTDSHGTFAVVLSLPGLHVPIELRLAPDAAVATAGYDPVTFAVDNEDALDAWISHFDAARVQHSPKLAGLLGALVVIATPDGLPIRLYTGSVTDSDSVASNHHETDFDNPWVNPPLMSRSPVIHGGADKHPASKSRRG